MRFAAGPSLGAVPCRSDDVGADLLDVAAERDAGIDPGRLVGSGLLDVGQELGQLVHCQAGLVSAALTVMVCCPVICCGPLSVPVLRLPVSSREELTCAARFPARSRVGERSRPMTLAAYAETIADEAITIGRSCGVVVSAPWRSGADPEITHGLVGGAMALAAARLTCTSPRRRCRELAAAGAWEPLAESRSRRPHTRRRQRRLRRGDPRCPPGPCGGDRGSRASTAARDISGREGLDTPFHQKLNLLFQIIHQ